MNAIRIRKKLDSDTLQLPELQPLIGKMVQITIEEDVPETERPASKEEWDAAMAAVDDLEGYDFDAVQRQRDFDFQHAKDHLP